MRTQMRGSVRIDGVAEAQGCGVLPAQPAADATVRRRDRRAGELSRCPSICSDSRKHSWCWAASGTTTIADFEGPSHAPEFVLQACAHHEKRRPRPAETNQGFSAR